VTPSPESTTVPVKSAGFDGLPLFTYVNPAYNAKTAWTAINNPAQLNP